MGNFQGDSRGGGGYRGGNGGGRPNFSKKSWGNDRGDRQTVMYKATCSECGKSCEVPFRPSGDKPVYCNDCFNKRRDDNVGDERPKRDFNDHGPKRDFGNKPSPRNDFKPTPVVDNSGKQLSEINMKLDRLISAIERMAEVKKEPVSTETPTEKKPFKMLPKKKVVQKKVTPKKKK